MQDQIGMLQPGSRPIWSCGIRWPTSRASLKAP